MGSDGNGQGRGRASTSDWDGTWKRLFERFPTEALELVCGIPAKAAQILEMPTERQRPMLPDRVFKVVDPDGGDRVVHVEIQTHPETGFELRLATYFTLLAARHGMPPHQVVIMPTGGPYTGHYCYGRLVLGYDVVDVTRLDPRTLVNGPLAALALWSSDDPEALIDRVVDRIAVIDDVEHQTVLVELAILRSERVAILIRDALQRRNMSNVLEGTRLGEELIARGEARGEARGRARVLRALLLERFGDVDGLDQVALALAAADDITATLKRVRTAETLHDLS